MAKLYFLIRIKREYKIEQIKIEKDLSINKHNCFICFYHRGYDVSQSDSCTPLHYKWFMRDTPKKWLDQLDVFHSDRI